MISTAKLIERVEQIGKSGTSGFTTEAEKNSILYSVQYEVLALLCDNFERSQKVSEALINHIKPVSKTSASTGIVTLPDDYYRTLSVLYGIYPCIKIGINELAMYRTSAIRKMDVAKSRVGYSFQDGAIVLEPASTLTVNLIYCKKPAEAKIAYTESMTDENDYLVVDTGNTVDIAFPEGLFNLFLYSILEKIGINQKENLLTEYSQLGINRETKNSVA